MCYTNCERFHASMLRHGEHMADVLASHLNISDEAKYSKIAQDLNICEPEMKPEGAIFNCCPFWQTCAEGP